jgi:hypothetical protein
MVETFPHVAGHFPPMVETFPHVAGHFQPRLKPSRTLRDIFSRCEDSILLYLRSNE